MLDIETLRVIQASIAIIVFVLVRFGSYRHTRSLYARGWSWVVVLSAASSGSYFLIGTSLDGLAAPLGNALGVASAGVTWATGRALRHASPRPWSVAGACAAVAMLSALDGRTDGTIPGTPALLAGMALMFALASREVWALVLDPGLQHSEAAIQRARPALRAMLSASTFLAAFYAMRLVAFVALGPDSSVYATWAGPDATTFVILVLLVVVTFTVTELSRFESTTAWQVRASRDDLTHLLARHAFEEHYLRHTTRPAVRSGPSVLVIADFDDFKAVNDGYGHDEGDRVLQCFGDALRDCLTDSDVACRWGGDEFVLLLAGTDAQRAQRALLDVNDAFASRAANGPSQPSISYGVAHVESGQSLSDALDVADEALRGAKVTGRARIVIAQSAASG
ncbi:GGDEF domain-containing protein [Demequina aestuarii]|uniref:GGDEF domain-containing protein n=1 Tax=Demequina aestuarii TaxID=327095 RepID=UPI000782E63C|nr:GGDEF domain-containing protein [Demequina aestuarii]